MNADRKGSAPPNPPRRCVCRHQHRPGPTSPRGSRFGPTP